MSEIAPCPICGSTPKVHKINKGFVLSCVGARHTVAMTDEDQHQVALYRGRSEEEVRTVWNRSFARGAA